MRLRRKTTLPDQATYHYELNGLKNIVEGSFAEAFRLEMEGAEAQWERDKQRAFGCFWVSSLKPDPWDEAVKWIERKRETEEEWPWPRS